MLPIVLAAVCFTPRLVVADTDTRTFKRLDNALAEPSDKKAWFVHFEQQCPAFDVPAWQGLQHSAARPVRRTLAACALPIAYDRGDLEELSVAISARPLGADELRGLSDADLILLRNVPFARHGYRFHNPKLLDYFSNKSWYRPTTDSEGVAERRCSRIENRNINAIIAFQKRQRGDTTGIAMQGSGSDLPALMTAVSERNIRESDLNGKTAWQLTLLRNTPYARHGFRFGTPRLTNYFRGKAWYRPDSGDQDVVSGRFNPFERRNVKFIADFQDANDLRDMP